MLQDAKLELLADRRRTASLNFFHLFSKLGLHTQDYITKDTTRASHHKHSLSIKPIFARNNILFSQNSFWLQRSAPWFPYAWHGEAKLYEELVQFAVLAWGSGFLQLVFFSVGVLWIMNICKQLLWPVLPSPAWIILGVQYAINKWMNKLLQSLAEALPPGFARAHPPCWQPQGNTAQCKSQASPEWS